MFVGESAGHVACAVQRRQTQPGKGAQRPQIPVAHLSQYICQPVLHLQEKRLFVS